MRPTYQGTSHHATAAACALFAPAPLGVTQHTNERARATSTTAPSCPLHTHSTRGTGRAIADEATSVPRVVVVVVSSVVCLGPRVSTQIAATKKKLGARDRTSVKVYFKRTQSPLFRTCPVAFVCADAAEHRPETCGHFPCLGTQVSTPGRATKQRVFLNTALDKDRRSSEKSGRCGLVSGGWAGEFRGAPVAPRARACLLQSRR